MLLVLEGKIMTPIITKNLQFHFSGCKVEIKAPRRRYINKINASKPMYPYSFVGYLGMIEISFVTKKRHKAEQKLAELLAIEHIGKFISEGFGLVHWLKGKIARGSTSSKAAKNKNARHLRIRKGLPHDLPAHVISLIRYALLHDFANTPYHKSKIYIEPNLEILEQLRMHHDKTPDPLIQQFQKYDRLAAIITRNIRSPRTNRYNWAATGSIDFEQLAQEIELVANQSVGKLYAYIYQSQALGQLNESLAHGHTSLRDHLLIIANLIVQDFQRGSLK